MSADCRPFCAASTTAAAATSVLPLPTSPCSSRFIGTLRRISCQISLDRAALRVVRQREASPRNARASPAGTSNASRVAVVLALRAPQLRAGREDQKLRKDETLARAFGFLRRLRRVHRAIRVVAANRSRALRERRAAADRAARRRAAAGSSSSPPRRSCGSLDPCWRDRSERVRRDTLRRRARCP